ncbi:class I SAM-dependent methyltransferase [Streptomyces sp. NPDC003233]
MIASPLDYWEPLWASGRRYREITDIEAQLLADHLGPGRGRPALDVGCGDNSLTRHLHDQLRYRASGIDCAPSAIALATGTAPAAHRPHFQVMDFATDRLDELPDSAYAVTTCRLVFRFLTHKDIVLNRIRQLSSSPQKRSGWSPSPPTDEPTTIPSRARASPRPTSHSSPHTGPP